MSKKEYYVGHMIKKGILIAQLCIVLESVSSFIKRDDILSIKIKFDKKYTFSELNSMDINLPYYTSNGRNVWVFQINDKKELIPELNRLSENKFTIEKKREFKEFLTNWI